MVALLPPHPGGFFLTGWARGQVRRPNGSPSRSRASVWGVGAMAVADRASWLAGRRWESRRFEGSRGAWPPLPALPRRYPFRYPNLQRESGGASVT